MSKDISKYFRVFDIRGILFDVDGTLYHPTPLRLIMVSLLLLTNIHKPKELIKTIRVIAAYRRAQETLRTSAQRQKDYPKRQIDLASKQTGESSAFVSEVVKEWFEKKPVSYLRLCRRRGMENVIGLLHQRGFRIGVYSDYPVEEKLRALGISHFFTVIISASDPEVKGFKPQTNGFSVAARRMGLKPAEILYVGDRPDVDGAGASAAGMQVVILNGLFKKRTTCEYPSISSCYDLLKIIPSSPR